MYLEIKKYLEEKFENNKFKNLRIKQLDDFIFNKKKLDFKNFSVFSKDLRKELKKYNLGILKLIKKIENKETIKFLFKTNDSQFIESVLMKHKNRFTVCVSSQIYCPLKCKFCATGSFPFKRNLSYWEIVLQVLLIEKVEKININNIVYMGMGEPFLNYENVIKSLEILTENMGKGARHITISTAGIVPKIKEFINIKKQFRLAISLHAPNNKIRDEIMPINKTYPLEKLFEVLDKYEKIKNKRITYEYVLIKDINDSLKEAKELAGLLKNRKSFVNLLIYNEHNFSTFKRSPKNRVYKFKNYLKKNNINVSIRKSLGDDIEGACGQLSAKTKN